MKSTTAIEGETNMPRKMLLVAIIFSVLGLLVAFALPGSGVQAQGESTVSILCSQYLRSEPTETATQIGRMNPGESHAALGRYGWWVYIQIDDSLRGWAYDGICLRVQGDFEALPVLDPDNLPAPVYSGPPYLNVECPQYVRSLPDLEATRLAIMQPADALWSPVGRNETGDWLFVSSADGTQAGWTSAAGCVSLIGDVNTLPIATGQPAVSASGTTATTLVGAVTARAICSQNLRTLPSLNGVRIDVVLPDDGDMAALARSNDAQWLFVQLASGQRGWTYRSECLTVQGDVLALPVQEEDVSVGAPSIVISCAQNLRALPAPNSDVVRVLQPEDGPMPVAGTTSEGIWVYLELPDGTTGWTVNGGCVTVLGRVWDAPRYAEGILPEDLILPPDTAPFASVVCSQYLRELPSLNAERIAIMNPGEGLYTITGRTEDGAWVQLSNDQRQGWAAVGSCLRVSGDILLAPILDLISDVAPSGQLICDQYLRTEPDLGAVAITPMSVGTPLSFQGRSDDGAWVYVSLTDGTVGWTALGSCLLTQGDVYSLPVIAQEQMVGSPYATLSCTQHLRTQPDDDADSVRILDGSEGLLRVTARNSAGSWIQLALDNGTTGWAATGFCLNVVGDFYTLPIIDVVTETAYSGPPMVDVVCDANLRRTPTSGGTVLDVLGADSGLLNIVSRTQDSRWLLIEPVAGQVGWVSNSSCVQSLGDLRAVPEVAGPSDTRVWTVLQAVGECAGSGQFEQLMSAYNRGAVFAPVSRICTGAADGLAMLRSGGAEFAVVSGTCPEFESVVLSGGQRICYNAVHQTQVDDVLAYLTGQ